DPILRAVNMGLVARYVVKPFERADLERTLAWGIETYLLGERHSEVQRRLLQTERLATIGSLTVALMHDLGNVLQHTSNDTQRLEDLAANAPALAAWLETGRAPADATRKQLARLAEELPLIAAALRESVVLMAGISTGAHRVLAPPSSEPVHCDPRRAIEDALAMFHCSTGRTRITYEGPAELPRVRIRAAELSQILLNLLANARDAIGERVGHIEIRAAIAGAAVEIVVRDDGSGMLPEVKRKAGTPFFTTRDGGTGIGLSQCRRLVSSAGGTMEIESAPGMGTSVRFTVPTSDGL
ncbi:MAG TPA: ATP-binding protein, partial [bacterium]|nr:ATP-binding protein [bacterium]